MKNNNLIRAISKDGSVVASVVNSTEMVAELERLHKPSAVITAALGRLCTAAALMGAQLKGDRESITLRINGGGPAGTLMAVADAHGNVKGTVKNTILDLPSNAYGKLDVGGAVGSDGFLDVIRDNVYGEPYTGRVSLVSGEIGDDITNYYATSEQTPTVCGLGVLVNADLNVASAGGFLVQLLPFCDPSVIDVIEKNIERLPSVSSLFSTHTPHEVVDILLNGLSPDILDETTARYRCDCSLQRVERALISLGREELVDMAKNNTPTEVECHFCDKVYSFSNERLTELAKG